MFFKKNTRDIGQQTEMFAKKYLQQQGLNHITSNYSCRKGEIDLIMLDQEQLVFVEVKYRSNKQYGSGFEIVDHHKQRKLIETARHYLNKKKLTESISCRFDVVSLEPTTDTKHNRDSSYNTDWIKNAFYCE